MPVVTELTIDANGAQRGADAYQAAMDKASQAMQRSLGALGAGVSQARNSIANLGVALFDLGTRFAAAQFVDAVVKANAYLAQLDETARQVGLTMGRLQEVQFAFRMGGADENSINSSLGNMSRNLYEASRAENDLSRLLDANNIKYKERNGALIDTNKLLSVAGDLIRRAASPQAESSIARAFGIDQSLVPTLRAGADEFERLAEEARKSGMVIGDDVIARAKQFDEEWRNSSVRWEYYLKAAISGILPEIDDIINKAAELPKRIAEAREAEKNGTVDDRPAISRIRSDEQIERDRAEIKRLADQLGDSLEFFREKADVILTWFTGRTEVSDVFDHITKSVNSLPQSLPAWMEPMQIRDMLAAQREFFANVKIELPQVDTSYITNPSNDPAKTSTKGSEYDRVSKALERMTAAREADIQTVGKSVGEQEYLRTAYRLNEAALQQWGVVNDKTREKIDALAQSAGAAAQKLAEARFKSNVDFQRDTVFLSPTDQGIAAQLHRLKGDDWPAYMHSAEANTLRWVAAMKDLQSVTSDFASGFAQDMMRGTRAIDALHNAVQRLATTLVDMAIKRLVADALGSLLGGPTGGGGALSALFKSHYGNVLDHGNAIQFADGGVVSQPAVFQMANGGLASIAEREPEAIMPLKRGADGRLGVAASGGGGSLTIAPVVNVSMPAGAKPSDGQQFGAEISRVIIATVQAEMVKQKRSGGLLN